MEEVEEIKRGRGDIREVVGGDLPQERGIPVVVIAEHARSC